MQEGKANLCVETRDVVSKELEVFYNPVMKHNRDVSLAILTRWEKTKFSVGLPLGGSGVRAVRFLLELDKKDIAVSINDYDATAVAKIHEHLKINSVSASVSCEDGNMFLLGSKGFDYIDIDPFGSPNAFLDAAIARSSRGGILAVTATDTAPLCGAYPNTCMRKYNAVPVRGPLCHEMGLRILIRKCQVVGAAHDKALVPLFCYSKDHYFRCYFRIVKSKTRVDELLKQHQHVFVEDNKFTVGSGPIGPLFVGSLIDREFCDSAFFDLLRERTDDVKWVDVVESELDVFGVYNMHELCREIGIDIPNFEKVFTKLREEISRTHFNPISVKTTLSFDEFSDVLRNI